MDRSKEAFAESLRRVVGQDACLTGEPMSRHTTFRVGGPADFFVCPKSEEELLGALRLCRTAGVPWFVMGNGSNLLVSDEGYRGVILCLYQTSQKLEIEGCEITARAGVLLSALAAAAKNHALTGLEFAAGIPGTLGGAVYMNAGAYGGEMKDVTERVRVLTPEGEILSLSAAELEFGYRTSRLAREGLILLSAKLLLAPGDREQIGAKMRELNARRAQKQPLEYPSAGSTFKRPEGAFAGRLIQDAGLAGYSVGGAQVSEKHCGFVINTGSASAADVAELIRQIRERVESMFGVRLEPEVRFLGEDLCV